MLTLNGRDEGCSQHRPRGRLGGCHVAALQALLGIHVAAPHIQAPRLHHSRHLHITRTLHRHALELEGARRTLCTSGWCGPWSICTSSTGCACSMLVKRRRACHESSCSQGC